MSKPEAKELEEMLVYLDKLRETGITNMYGSAPFVQNVFGVDKHDAKNVVLYWMETFEERHNE